MQGKLLLAIVSCVGMTAPIQADDGTTCLIFSGGADKECALDLSRYNRITFGENSMTVSSAANPDDKVELLYSLYHHFEIGTAQLSGIETVGAAEARLVYDASSASLKLEAPADAAYTVGVFALNGVMMRQSDVSGGGSLSLESLQPGVYIAVAAGKIEDLKIKFVK